ncbi:hypothetical protein Taro_055533, partial [Colocasia esculenta]|nr:hypothetical protein [Colocasia esculenta]
RRRAAASAAARTRGDAVLQSRRHAEYLEKVRGQLLRVDSPGKAMATVDALQRLGIDYHFEEEVGTLLQFICESFDDDAGAGAAGDLHDVSLSFRLLRQGRFHVPTDPFDRFMDGQGSFKESISKGIPGLLNLHEASYLGVQGEHVLDEAQAFSQKHLKASMGWLEPGDLAQQVIREALDHPYHTTPQRYKSRKYLEHFEGRSGGDEMILLGELARLDFNMVQTLHRMELLRFSKWWNTWGMSQDLVFARNQPLKWYMWSMAALSNPKFSDYRFEFTKCIALIYIIDDIFDVYGSLEELVLFTETVKKWDSPEVGTLPSCMEICYTTLYDVTNEIASKVYKEHGWNPISSLKK